MDVLLSAIENYSIYSDILNPGYSQKNIFHLDLGPNNNNIQDLDMTDNAVFNNYITDKLGIGDFVIAAGGYNEKRILYSKSNHFGEGESARNIHLGVDLWASAGTSVSAPLDAEIHSFKNNVNYRDYGPTIILLHRIDTISFYTLYGHLSLESLKGISAGTKIKAGEVFATIGNEGENGNWPPHVHFQLIRDMGKYVGDFPGVASKKDRDYYLNLCPNPNLILRIPELN